MGGVEALSRLVAQLPEDFPAAVFVVLHLAPNYKSVLPDILSRAGRLPARHPEDQEPVRKGHIYVAPNDMHLMVDRGHVRVVKGPRENGHRPAVDPLFRSAARAYGPRVVGVVLTGALDCGTGGLLAVKAQGGVAVVQNPEEAFCPDMPRSALEYVKVDHIASLAEMGALLGGLVSSPVEPTPRRRVTPGLEQEVKLVEVEKQDMTAPPEVGNPSYFSCPDCGGVLFEVDDEGLLRYRCRTGHGYTSKALEVGQHQKLDSALWAAVRALEENAALGRRLAARAREQNHLLSAQRYEARASAAAEQALLVRQVVLGGSPPESAPGNEAGEGEETQETGSRARAPGR